VLEQLLELVINHGVEVVVDGLKDRIEMFESFIDGCLKSLELRQEDCDRGGFLPLPLHLRGEKEHLSMREEEDPFSREFVFRSKMEPADWLWQYGAPWYCVFWAGLESFLYESWRLYVSRRVKSGVV
jgi:hypothetical protein